MAVSTRVLIPAKTAENTQTTQYTATNVTAIIDKFTATNYTATAAPISVNLVAASGSYAHSLAETPSEEERLFVDFVEQLSITIAIAESDGTVEVGAMAVGRGDG